MRYRKYTTQDFNETLVLFVEAFSKYPMYTAAKCLFETNADYMIFLRFILGVFLRVQQKYNRIVLGEENGRIIAAAVIASPHDAVPAKKDFLLSVGLETKLPASISDIMDFRKFVISAEEYIESLDIEENWGLYMLAVKREYQGRGAGRHFMEHCVMPLIRHHGGKYLSFTTHTRSNVAFYESMGFELLDTNTLYFKENMIVNRSMGIKL